MATTLLENVNQSSTDRDKAMSHVFDPMNDGYAMCGLRLTRIAEGNHDDEADCIVCEDLWKARYPFI